MTLPLAAHLDLLPERCQLGAFPSPLESRVDLAAEVGADHLLIKREDLGGGNKLRALEFLLPATGPALVTMGGFGSTWCGALARATAATGQRAEVALFPQPWSETVAGVLAGTARSAGVHLAPHRLLLPLALYRAWRSARRHGPVTWLPAGGAQPLGVLGAINALLECAEQLDQLGSPPPEALVVPYGSGGTAAGLLVGAWLLAWDVRIVAVRVTDPWYTTRRRILRLAERTVALLRRHGARRLEARATLQLDGGQLGPGYGHGTPGARVARSRGEAGGLTLDLTYGAKAFAALPTLATSFRRLCFWHTFDARLPASSQHPVVAEAHRYAELLWPRQKSTSPSTPMSVTPTDT